MSMSKEPRRILISAEREIEEKKRNKYTELAVYDPDFLDEYKQQIIDSFSSNPELQARVAKNLGDITEVVVGDRVKTGQSRIILSKKQIHLDSGYVDVTETSFTLKPEAEHLETNLVRTLLYAASRKKGLTGVIEYERDENNKVIGRKNVGLNGGIAQYLAEEITGKPVPAEEDCYAFNKDLVSLLSDVLGKDIITTAFYEDSSVLKDTMNALAGDPEFFDKFNKDLDTINKLQETVRRIKSGAIVPKDPEALARMETVLKAQQERLVETVFANVILPQIQKIVVDSEDRLDTYRARQEQLLPLLEKHEYLLKVVAKYISLGRNSEFVSDEALAAIRQEIKENGIDFAQIVAATRNIDPNKKTSAKNADTLTTAVGEFYDANEASLTTDRSTELSPFLRKELEKMLEIYDKIKEIDPEGFSDYDAWFRAHFSKVPNLDQEMERIREEKLKKAATPTEGVEPPEVAAARAAGMNAGGAAADEKPKTTAPGTDGTAVEPDKAKAQEDTSILSKKFVASDLTGQVLDQRNLSIYNKAVNHAIATGEGINPDDAILVQMRAAATAEYMRKLPRYPSPALYEVYGDKWREVLQAAYEEGYRQGMAERLQQATQEGMEVRKDTEVKIANGQPIEEPAHAVDFEELQFINETFAVVPREGEDNVYDIVNRATNKPVLSSRTVTATVYAEDWVEAVGIEREDGTKDAFTPKHAEIFENMQTALNANTNETGEIDLETTLETMDPAYAEIAKGMLTEERVGLIRQFNSLAVAKPQVTEPEVVEEPTPKRPEAPMTELNQVVEFASEATLEEITPHLEVFGGEPKKTEDGVTVHPFNDPLMASRLNERYRALKGEDHPMFVANAPALIDDLMENKDELLAAKAYTPETFDRLEAVRKDLESRHPELVPEVTEEKAGHK